MGIPTVTMRLGSAVFASALALTVATVPVVPAAAATRAVCPDVYMIGARGSGEPEQSKPGTMSYHGLGKEIYKVGNLVESSLRPRNLTFKTIADPYDAPSVDDLKPTKGEILTFNLKYYYDHNLLPFLEAINTGVGDAVSAAQLVHAQCPHSWLIMAGYSQGAMVMHQAELRLAAGGYTGVTSSIVGTILLADGDEVAATAARRYGSSSSGAEGVRTWFPHWLTGTRRRDVLSPGATASICNAHDAVCDFSRRTIKSFGGAFRVHTSYVTTRANGTYRHVDNAIIDAARWIADLVVERHVASKISWTSTTVPLPPNAASSNQESDVQSVACRSPRDCLAVGYYEDKVGYEPMVLSDSAGTWRARELALPANAARGAFGGFTTQLVCPSSAACTVIGAYEDSEGNPEMAAFSLSGSAWTASVLPSPGAPIDQRYGPSGIQALACPSANYCVAVGRYQAAQNYTYPWIDQGAGTHWQIDTAMLPENADADPQAGLNAVACPTVSDCVAVGGYLDAAAGYHEALINWASGKSRTWYAHEPSLPANAATSAYLTISDLNGIDCPSPSECAAVGYYFDKNAGYSALMLTGSGSVWKAAEAPRQRNALENSRIEAEKVTCASPASCVALGLYEPSPADPPDDAGFALTGSGSAWKATKALLPGDGDPTQSSALASVSCLSAILCVAVGDYGKSVQYDAGMVAIFDGTSWVTTRVGTPRNATFGSLNSVTCPSVVQCLAVGTGYLSSNAAPVIWTGKG